MDGIIPILCLDRSDLVFPSRRGRLNPVNDDAGVGLCLLYQDAREIDFISSIISFQIGESTFASHYTC